MKITVAKSEETIKKEERLARIETLKARATPSNKEIAELLIMVLDELKGLK